MVYTQMNLYVKNKRTEKSVLPRSHIFFDAFDGVFLKARDLRLRDADLTRDLHLRLAVGVAQGEDEPFARAQAAHRLLERNKGGPFHEL